jgi:hypothetical protein
MGWFWSSKYFQLKEPPIPILLGKRKEKEQAGSSWLFQKPQRTNRAL